MHRVGVEGTGRVLSVVAHSHSAFVWVAFQPTCNRDALEHSFSRHHGPYLRLRTCLTETGLVFNDSHVIDQRR